MRSLRELHGCDAPVEEGKHKYVILCPVCDGTKRTAAGAMCRECEDDGMLRGFKAMRRCPGHYQTSDVSVALNLLSEMRKGFLPVPGGLLDQAAGFCAFKRVFDAEFDRVSEELREEG